MAWRVLLATIAAIGAGGVAWANSTPKIDVFAGLSDPQNIVLAVATPFEDEGASVRLMVYDREETFLEAPIIKNEAQLDDAGRAVFALPGLAAGEYAFVVYYDRNGDRTLNRGFLGRPKEPFAFSNGVRPRFSRPDFEDAKVAAAPGGVVVIHLDD